ncbi:NUDIX hydrolase [Fictibacillus phosphorivorans]|uniref:NUDIX hydrolase n=1 Tax=Fictibacillus phosphorivorans TaxID=1221500 RepID=UPI00203A5F9A|nr:NUDIX hydrolase [Fictibacillus phosphorivorans]MCM3719568.1 NUDIX hydrolase [Fictibacillus phosphorivorans]MCM3777259.1 NUDIX hydrolase [Fictibacillus phosphorivorans]
MDAVFHVEHQVFNYRVAGVFIQEGHVLIHRSKNETHWSLPGGRVKVGEDARSSLKREMLEELAIDVEVRDHISTVENFFTYNGKDFHEVGLYFLIKARDPFSLYKGEEFSVEEAERLVFKWVSIEELGSYKLYPEFIKNKVMKGPLESEYAFVGDL